MNTIDIIVKKKNGGVLEPKEIKYMIEGYTDGDIPDYQMSAFLMAICIKGMTREETTELTKIMRDSGDTVDLSEIRGIKVDKHSTGGVGDKTTLIVASIAAACGVPVAKMSGRGLGFTGGTVDKLESIPGLRTSMDRREFIDAVNSRGIAIIGQTGRIAPADKKIYALRDVTGTTESLSLITSSIMSKKLAAGADAIVLDVKCGEGAFMKKYDDATELAEWMVEIGKSNGKKMIAVISDMDQPLGKAVGNALEVGEAIDVLKCEGPEDITELSVELAGAMLYLGDVVSDDLAKARELAEKTLADGRALNKFREFVEGQGGDPAIISDRSRLPQAACCVEVRAEKTGYVNGLNAMTIGLASQHAGAGRERKDDEIDMSAGIVLEVKRGDKVTEGDVLCTVYGNDIEKVKKGASEALGAYVIEDAPKLGSELIKHVII